MNNKLAWIIILFLLFCLSLVAQNNTDSLYVNFKPVFGKVPLELTKKYSSNKDTLTIETFKCYISNIEIQYKDNSYFIQENSHHLLDLTKSDSFKIPTTKNNDKLISKISFTIGIDSVTNNSGALSGDLDPINGMYWAWQSGYINMKVEGKSPSCPTRKNEFQFHIGGYLDPNYAMRKVAIDVNKKEVDIAIDLKEFFFNINLHKTNSIMIPCKAAMELANISVKMFYAE